MVLDYALTARGLTVRQVRDALLREPQHQGGNIDEGKNAMVRTVGQFTDLKQIENVIITSQNGHPVYVRDIAKVHLASKSAIRTIRLFGQLTMGFGVLGAREPIPSRSCRA